MRRVSRHCRRARRFGHTAYQGQSRFGAVLPDLDVGDRCAGLQLNHLVGSWSSDDRSVRRSIGRIVISWFASRPLPGMPAAA